MTTELELEHWRRGQVAAERLCLHLLALEGFENLDPQCPLGGRDGKKDILCVKSNWQYVAAVYFPLEKPDRFSHINKKFKGDLAGVKSNKADGIVFLTGQKISPGERKKLETAARKVGAKAIIYHQERIRGLLDSATGFALRLEYLGIPMRPEEQMAFVLAIRELQNKDLEASLRRVEAKVDALLSSFASVWSVQTTAFSALATFSTHPKTTSITSSLPQPSVSAVIALRTVPAFLTKEVICELHGALMFEAVDSNKAGTFRTGDVWIGGPGSAREEALYTPPSFIEVPELMEQLLADWNAKFGDVSEADVDTKIDAITAFHYEFLRIHPFFDGNGRVSRYLVQAQAQRLNLTERPIQISERSLYFRAIATAHAGDLGPLRRVIYQAITGEDREQ